MSRTYKATGINLKSMPIGESDRLLTVLTREYGLVRVMAMGARKHRSSLAGRSGLFVVNELLIARGKSLDKLTQAETLESYPGLSQDLKKLTASQYLAELCLFQALSDQPQEDLFDHLNRHLQWLERSPAAQILPYLAYAIFQLLTLEGVAPQVYRCCLTQTPLRPNLEEPNWQVGFSAPVGGIVTLASLQTLRQRQPAARPGLTRSPLPQTAAPPTAHEATGHYQPKRSRSDRSDRLHQPISGMELALLQAIAQRSPTESCDRPDFSEALHVAATPADWLAIERLLRQYAHYHFDRPIRSAALIESCFANSVIEPPLLPSKNA